MRKKITKKPSDKVAVKKPSMPIRGKKTIPPISSILKRLKKGVK